MSDFLVGKKASGSKDRYMVGYNQGSKPVYKVGGGGSNVAQASNQGLGGKGMDPVVGSKSAFNYKENDYKDIGDQNGNMGGKVSDGVTKDPTGPGGQIKLIYTEKGDWTAEKDAMARRKAYAEASSKYYGTNSEHTSPVPMLLTHKK